MRWLAASVFALAPVSRVTAQTAPEPSSNAAPDATAAPAQSEYTLPLLPKVTCDHDQLSIEADNATLVSVLSAVESCLGVQIRPPAGFRDERTFTHLGPGRADRVLDDLLSSLDLNYAIVLSSAAGRKVTGVVLTSRVADNAEEKPDGTSPAASGVPMTAARRLWLASQMTSGRPMTPAEQAEEPPRDPDPPVATPASRGIPESLGSGTGIAASGSEGTAGVSQGSAAAQTSAAGGGTVTAGKDDQSAASRASQTTAAASPVASAPPIAPSAAPAASDPAADAKANPLGQQINQMQQMFEQRRKLNAPAPPTPDPQ